MYNLREGLARISASPGTSSEPHTKRRVLFCFFFLPSPVLRAPGRVGQHRLLRKLVLRRAGRFRRVSERTGGGGVYRARRRRATGTRGRSRALETARRVTGASSPSGEFGRVRERAGGSRRARRKAQGCRAARFSQRSRAGIARTHSALHLVLGPVPVRLGGLVPVFLPVDDGRDEAGARESATTAHGATGVAGQGKTEGGVRGRTPPHGPIAVG